MLEIVLVLLLLLLCVLICLLFAVAGFFIGYKACLARKEKPPDVSEQAKVRKKKLERELDNFYSYTGDKQE